MFHTLCRLMRIAVLLLLLSYRVLAPACADGRQDYLNKQLSYTCWKGLPEEAQRLIARGADVNAQLPPDADYYTTPMHRAAEEGHADILRLLIAHGAKVDLRDSYDTTPLMRAVGNDNTECVEALLDAGANPNAVSLRLQESVLLSGRIRGTPGAIVALLRKAGLKETIWEAALLGDLHTVRDLLETGTPADERSPWGTTPLMAAVNEPDRTLLDLLIAHGADVNAQDSEGKTALMYLADRLLYADQTPFVQTLVKHGARLEIRDNEGRTALIHAHGNARLLTLLLDHGANLRARDNQGRTVLMYAADWNIGFEAGGWEAHGGGIPLLLKRGAEVNARDQDGRTALEIATANHQVGDTVVALLEAGADPNAADNRGITPLMWAAALGNSEQIEALRKAGAKVGLMEALLLGDTVARDAMLDEGMDINRCGPEGITPLMLVAGEGDLVLTERLLELGAKTDVRDDVGRTVLHHAVGAKDGGWAYFREPSQGGFPGQPSRDTSVKDRPALIQFLIAYGVPTDGLDSGKATPLQWAAHWGFTGDVKILLKKGAAPWEAREDALVNAQVYGHDAIVRLLMENGMRGDTHNRQHPSLLILAVRPGNAAHVAYLLAHHADVNARDPDGATPLMRAAELGDAAIICLLLAAHADPTLKDYEERTARDYIDPAHRAEIGALLPPSGP